MGIDYGEILCTAVDEIITARMSGLAYDITKLCTIVDDTNSYQGKYVVSDGTARYEAYSTDNNLKKGNSVLVTIPNGDYSMQKIIKGRVAATDTTPFRYTSPLDTMISIKSEFTDTVIGENQGLTANDSLHPVTDVIYSIGSTQALTGISGFTRLGVSANFKSLLSNFDVVSGSYGIKLVVYSEVIDKPGSKKDAVYVLDFNSADMIGNPYQFEDFFSQEKVFDISYINRVKRVDAYFYQGNNFIDGNGDSIPSYVSTGEGFGEIITLPHNLFVDGIKVYLGYDKNDFKDETLMIYTDDSLGYHYTLEGQENKPSENRKTVQLRWIHKVSENEFTLITNNDIDDQKYEVNWFRYSPGWENVDKYAGKNWEKINTNTTRPMECQFDPDITKQKEEIKAVGIIRDGSQTNIDGKIENLEKAYVSNLLTFENEEEVPDNKTWEASSALQIRCEDDSEGNYYIYNQNGKINNQGIGQGYVRYLKVYYKGAEITSDLGSLDYIKWYIPAEKSMMIYTDALGKENGGEPEPEKVLYKQVNYKLITRKPKDGIMNTTQGYSIGNQWTYQNSNNTVRCQVSIDGVIYEAAEELRFGKSGTNGTNVTLVLELDDNANAITAIEDEKISVSLWMYNEEGARTGFTGATAKDIEWAWYKESDTKYMEFSVNKSNPAQVFIISKTNIVPEDNYFILQATYNGLTSYLPIPIKATGTSFIEGAREVIYDHQGIPSYYNDVYNLYYLGTDGKYQKVPSANVTGPKSIWTLTCDGKDKEKEDTVNSYFPTLKNTNYGVALSAAAFYAKGYSDKVCIKGSYNDYAWSQPILIMQSRYDFAMLNDWDGTLTLDKDNGTILSTMLGAGRKNSDNSFSGVLIGDIKQGTDLESANSLTGVYGLQNGRISYSLTEDGKATFGKKNQGQIIIDGNKSTIQSANYHTDEYDKNNTFKKDKKGNYLNDKGEITKDPKEYVSIYSAGTLIDLDDGFIDMKYPDKGKIKLSSKEAPYFQIISSKGNPLINIGISESNANNFIQSDSGTEGSIKLDLSEGSFNAQADGKMQFLIDATPIGDNPYLKLAVPSEGETASNKFSNNLLYLSDSNFYLQSKDYQTQRPLIYQKEGIAKGNFYKYIGENLYNHGTKENPKILEKDQIIVILKKDKSNSDQKTICIASKLGDEYITDGIPLTFQDYVTEKEYTDADGKPFTLTTTLKQEAIERNIKTSSIPIYDKEGNKPKGFKLDLNNSLINGYDLYLKGTSSDDNSRFFILDSNAVDYPFQIGDKCKIRWDGSIDCSDITISGNSIIQGGSRIDLGTFWVDGSTGQSGGYFNGTVKGVSGYGGVSLSSLKDALNWTVYVR